MIRPKGGKLIPHALFMAREPRAVIHDMAVRARFKPIKQRRVLRPMGVDLKVRFEITDHSAALKAGGARSDLIISCELLGVERHLSEVIRPRVYVDRIANDDV
jgi:hypothetical protein